MSVNTNNVNTIDYDLLTARVKETIKNNGLTQAQFAESINLPKTSLNTYFRRNTGIPVDVLYKISKKYNVSVDYLLGLDTETENKNCEKEFMAFFDILYILGAQVTEVPETPATFNIKLTSPDTLSYIFKTHLKAKPDLWYSDSHTIQDNSEKSIHAISRIARYRDLKAILSQGLKIEHGDSFGCTEKFPDALKAYKKYLSNYEKFVSQFLGSEEKIFEKYDD